MSEHGGEAVSAEQARRSRLYDYVDASEPGRQEEAEGTARGRREFAALLGEFRRTAVLVPVGEGEAPLTADFGGVRWIYAFSDEGATGGPDDPYMNGLVYFAKERQLAEMYAKHYGEGVIEIQIPMREYLERFSRHEHPYEGGPLTELEIPNTVVEELNQYPRIRHR
ncbi:hypothetical protein OG399_13825 [Streptomyces achromogenes]